MREVSGQLFVEYRLSLEYLYSANNTVKELRFVSSAVVLRLFQSKILHCPTQY